MLGSAEEQFLNMLSLLTRSLGLGEAAGKVWGILALVGRPMTQSEIARLTGYSLPIVSTAISVLENWGFVVRAGRRGRARLYRASSTILDILENFLNTLLDRRLNPLAKFLRENLSSFKPEYREGAARLLKEYEKARALVRQMIQLTRDFRKGTVALAKA